MDADTPMFFRYSMWIGDTERSVEWVRSIGLPVAGLSTGTIGDGV